MNISSQISSNINQVNINKKQDKRLQISSFSTITSKNNMSVPYDRVSFSARSNACQKVIDNMKIEKRNISTYIKNINSCLPEKYHLDPEKTGYDQLVKALKNIKPDINKTLKEIEKEHKSSQVKDEDIPIILEILRRRFGIGYKKLHIQAEIMEKMELKESRFIRLNKKGNELLCTRMQGLPVQLQESSNNAVSSKRIQQTKKVERNLNPVKKFGVTNLTNLNIERNNSFLDGLEKRTQETKIVDINKILKSSPDKFDQEGQTDDLLSTKMMQEIQKCPEFETVYPYLTIQTISKIVNSLRIIFDIRLVAIRTPKALIDEMNQKLISGKSMRETLEYNIKNFSPKEKAIVEYYFGLNGKDILTNIEITEKLNLSNKDVPAKIIEKLLYNGKKPEDRRSYIIRDGVFTKNKLNFFSTVFPEAYNPYLNKYMDLVTLINKKDSFGKSMKECLEESLDKVIAQNRSNEIMFRFKYAVELLAGLNGQEMSTYETIKTRLQMSSIQEVYTLIFNPKRISMLIENIPPEHRLDPIIYGFDVDKLTGKANNLPGNQRKMKQKDAAMARIKAALYGVFKRKFKIRGQDDLLKLWDSPYSAGKSRKMFIEEVIKDLPDKDKCIIRDCLGLDGELLNNTEITKKYGLANADDHINLVEKHLYNNEKIVIDIRDGSATKFRINLLSNLLPGFNVPKTVKYDELCGFLNTRIAHDKTVKEILLEAFEKTSEKFPDDTKLLMQIKAIKLWLGLEDGMEMLKYSEIKEILINKYKYKYQYDDMSSFVNKESGIAKIRANVPLEYNTNLTVSDLSVAENYSKIM